MTTLTVVDGQRNETRPEAIARRLRGELGQLNLSVSEVARRTGMSQPALSRRMTGQLPFDVAELDLICDTLGISFDYITTGIREVPAPRPPGQWGERGGDPEDGAPSRARTYDLRISSAEAA
jgi:transcriptional regulator with XRE-family HTH domain